MIIDTANNAVMVAADVDMPVHGLMSGIRASLSSNQSCPVDLF